MPAQRKVLNIHSSTYARWVREDGSPFEGEGYLRLDESFAEGTGFFIYRMDPGVTSAAHEHTCAELFVVISGELTDNDGYTYRQGDYVLLEPGTQHCSTAGAEGAVLGVFVRSLERDL